MTEPDWKDGWYPPEADQTGPFRWSSTRAACVFRLPQKGRKILRLVASTPEADGSRTLRVQVDGADAGETRLGWGRQTYLFPFTAEACRTTVSLALDRPLDARYVEPADRRRDLGACVHALQVLDESELGPDRAMAAAEADGPEAPWIWGWDAPEPAGGGPLRWSRVRAACRLRLPSLGEKLLRIDASTPEQDLSRTLSVSVNGHPLGTARLAWHRQSYLFPFTAVAPGAEVSLAVDRPLDPRHIHPRDGRRDLGLAVHRIEVLDRDYLEDTRLVADRPGWLIIETTSSCNIRCEMCAITAGMVPAGMLSWERFQQLAPLFPALLRADLYGHGETFLHPRFFDMLEALGRHGCNCRVITNATKIDDAAAERLVALRLDKLIVSFDAASPALFEEVRRGASYRKVLENIRRVLDARDAAGSLRPHLQFQYMGMLKTVHEFPEFVRMAADLGAERVSLVSLAEYPKVAGQALHRDPSRARPHVLEAMRVAAARGIRMDWPGHELRGEAGFDAGMAQAAAACRPPAAYADGSPDTDLLLEQQRQTYDGMLWLARAGSGRPLRKCCDPWTFLYVAQDGSLRPCCVTAQLLGHLDDGPVLETWNGERTRLFRDRFLRGELPECGTCPNREWMPAG